MKRGFSGPRHVGIWILDFFECVSGVYFRVLLSLSGFGVFVIGFIIGGELASVVE